VTPEELSERLINFAARIGKVVDALPDTRNIIAQSIVTAKKNRGNKTR
jgi:hypothetical protein